MKIVKTSVELIRPQTYEDMLMTFNTAARNCYKSENPDDDMAVAEKLARKLISVNHGSPLEMNHITVRLVCDRATMAQLTRHRLASYCIESQRYCNYSKDKFGQFVKFIRPVELDADCVAEWEHSCKVAEKTYFDLLKKGMKPEVARSVLPNCTATTIVMSANVREMRHILRERTSKFAQADIRKIMTELLHMLQEKYPVFFGDIE